ncbi:phage tail protein [Actinophytocola sp.]|uniref:phage tail protein n=1 Tax=Actinophytocola sp. TaxID=1872138 RepID=UPI002D7F5798|nr:phage tail protein [Actinophytocola sp.]HET9144144.1 phage tail protein [Actinophytocola sp.]
MTTPLASEPMPGDGQVPEMSTLADRLYQRLPEVYRTMDAADSTWPFKRYLAGLLAVAGQIDDTVDGIGGDRPIGPAQPEPWALPADQLANWRDARLSRASALADPTQAEAAWLPWLAQLVGAVLDPAASEQEKRDTIRYATSGWRGGTRQAIADAAKSALNGTQYVRVLAHTKNSGGSLVAGTAWEITVVTRLSETPDVNAVLGAVLRKGVKPAGAVLYHYPATASWSAVTTAYNTWASRVGKTWLEIEETGL